MRTRALRIISGLGGVVAILALTPAVALAQDGPTPAEVQATLDNIWVFIVVHWTWGGGLIAQMNVGAAVFSDFAGSGIVHMTGGILALMGSLFLGPRIGKYTADGKPRAIPGHNIPFLILGVFILWVGWFGFNPGSELAADGAVMTIALNTMIAAAAGGIATTITIWLKSGKPDLAMIGKGVLAGLVSITASSRSSSMTSKML